MPGAKALARENLRASRGAATKAPVIARNPMIRTFSGRSHAAGQAVRVQRLFVVQISVSIAANTQAVMELRNQNGAANRTTPRALPVKAMGEGIARRGIGRNQVDDCEIELGVGKAEGQLVPAKVVAP